MKHQYWKELWESRHVFGRIVWRNFTLRYKQAFLGIAWGVLRPLLMILVFTFVFTVLVQVPSNGVPYFLLVATALIPWNFFSLGISEASTSLLANQHLISKVYIPRILFPLAAIAVQLFECVTALCIVILLAAIWGVPLSTHLLAIPFFLFLLTGITAGVGIFLAALNVQYRDTNHFLPVLLQTGILISPVGFATSLIPDQWKNAFFMSPIAGLIEGFRWSILDIHPAISTQAIIISCLVSTLICIAGIVYFRKTEGNMADFL